MSSDRLQILSPCRGRLLPIHAIPDPVFADKMVGDGCGFDPLASQWHAPISGQISQVHSAQHAVAIRHPSGIELLLHLGLDTVQLQGQGIQCLVEVGQQVEQGQLILQFDADLLAQRARSLISALIVTNPEQVEHFQLQSPGVVEDQQCLMTLTLSNQSEATTNSSDQQNREGPVRLLNPQGIHARPAAMLVNEVKRLQVQAWLSKGEQTASARSVVALMGLGTQRGDPLVLRVQGENADLAFEQLSQLIAKGLGEDCPELTEQEIELPPNQPEEQPLLGQQQVSEDRIQAIAAAPGLASGRVHRLTLSLPSFSERSTEPEQEPKRLASALQASQARLERLIKEAKSGTQADIFAAHQLMLADDDLGLLMQQGLQQGLTAEAALEQAFSQQTQQLKQSPNPLMQSRASDLDDLKIGLLRSLLKVAEPEAMPADSILVLNDLSPSMAANLNPKQVQAVITAMGGASSHAAILARSLGIPAVAGLGERLSELQNGQQLLVSGDQGWVQTKVSPEQALDFNHQQQQKTQKAQQDLAACHQPTNLRQGRAICVAANIISREDALQAQQLGAEGAGLVRTEFLFQDRQQPPTEDEQYQCYLGILAAMPGQSVIIRTLDIGGDKPLAYLPMPAEENPFLGERGIRIGLNRPSLLAAQLRAILRAHAECGNAKIMLPMIARQAELLACRQFMLAQAQDLGLPTCELGIMIEVPSAALMADQLAKSADFFSIGTNDLTQYVLAMDRGHPKMGAFADGLEPSVLRAIAQTCQGAQPQNRWVGVCGGLASEPLAVPILIGLGVTELSVSVPALPEIRALVRRLDEQACQNLAKQALAADDGRAVRALSQQFLQEIAHELVE